MPSIYYDFAATTHESRQQFRDCRDAIQALIEERGFWQFGGDYHPPNTGETVGPYNDEMQANNESAMVPSHLVRTCPHCETRFYEYSSLSANSPRGDQFCSIGCVNDWASSRNMVQLRTSGGVDYWHEFDGRLMQYCTANQNRASTSNAHPYLIGFEIEKEDCDYYDDSDFHQSLYNEGWLTVSDGSLYDGGFEAVSPAFNLTRTRGEWSRRELQKHLEEHSGGYLDAGSSSACGGHITLSKRGATGLALVKQLREFIPLLLALYPNRVRGEYAQIARFRYSADMRESTGRGNGYSPDNDTGQKFRAINTKLDRVEFRIFSGVESSEQLDWRIRLIDIACRITDAEESILTHLADDQSDLVSLLSERVEDIEKLRNRTTGFNQWLNGETVTTGGISRYVGR